MEPGEGEQPAVAEGQGGSQDQQPKSLSIDEGRALQSANDKLRNDLAARDAELEELRGKVGTLEGETAQERTARLAAHRDLVIAKNPDLVPELVTGASVEEIDASIETAKAAYSRIAETTRAAVTSVQVPAGAPARQTAEQVAANMTPQQKIEAGLSPRK